jgi:hypothetical protein
MASKKRQQTMAKMRREQAVRERRALKQEKKEAARAAKAAGDAAPTDPEAPLDDEELIEEPAERDDSASGPTADKRV